MTAVLEVQGREQTIFCRPVHSFSKAAQQVEMKNKDRPHPAVRSCSGLLVVSLEGPIGPQKAADASLELENMRALRIQLSKTRFCSDALIGCIWGFSLSMFEGQS